MRIVDTCRKHASYTCSGNSYVLPAYSLKKLFLECVPGPSHVSVHNMCNEHVRSDRHIHVYAQVCVFLILLQCSLQDN